MAASHAGHAAIHAGSPAKIRPIPSRRRKAPVSGPAPGLTAGRTGGVGLPTEADRPVTAKTRAELALVAEAAASALDGLAALDRHAREVADAFRWRHIDQARLGLADLVESTQTLLKLAVIAAQVAGTDVITLCRATDRRADAETQAAADKIISAQLTRDWAALACAIDSDLTGALDLWRGVFERIVAGLGDGAPGGRAA